MSPNETTDLSVSAVEIVFKTSVILGLAALIGILIRRKFPSGAHLAWMLAFCIVTVLPLATVAVPGRAVVFLNLRPGQPSRIEYESQRARRFIARATIPTAAPQPSTVVNPTEEDAENQPPALLLLALESPWFLGILLLWLVGFLFVTGRSAYGLLVLASLRKHRTEDLPLSSLPSAVERLFMDAGRRRALDLRICTTSVLPMPMTWGVFRPTIVLPREAQTWTSNRLEATVLHELSHVRRYDFLSQVLAEFVCALYWFNPLVWLCARAMRSDAELAADEAVLHSGLKPSDYARELLMLAADLGKRPIPFATLGTPAMTNSKIETRLESILSPSAGRRGVTTVQALAALAIAALAVPTFGRLHATAQGQDGDDAKSERTVALSNAKQIALATIMYANDFDDDLPYVQQTASAVEVLGPYTRNKEVFKSPAKGGRFLFNMNLAGVNMTAVEYPAQTPLWIESLKDTKIHVAVAFLDGHAKLLDPLATIDEKAAAPEFKGLSIPKGTTWLKAASSLKFPRAKTMKPLPYNYLLPEKP